MTVLASSRVGWAGPADASPFSPGRLRIVTAISKQTGLDRVFCSELLSALSPAGPSLVKPFNGEDTSIASVMASRSRQGLPPRRCADYHAHFRPGLKVGAIVRKYYDGNIGGKPEGKTMYLLLNSFNNKPFEDLRSLPFDRD